MGVGGQRHSLPALPPGRRPGTPCTGGWVSPSAGLDVCGKSRPTEIKHLISKLLQYYINFVELCNYIYLHLFSKP
jgi:hypothetical protein